MHLDRDVSMKVAALTLDFFDLGHVYHLIIRTEGITRPTFSTIPILNELINGCDDSK